MMIFFLFHLMQAKGRETGWPASLEKQPEERHGHICKVCFEAPTAAVLLPCRHFCCKFYSIILFQTYIFFITIEYKPLLGGFSLRFALICVGVYHSFFPFFYLCWCDHIECKNTNFCLLFITAWSWCDWHMTFFSMIELHTNFFYILLVNMIKYITTFLYVIEIYDTLLSLNYIPIPHLNALCVLSLAMWIMIDYKT